MVCAHFIPKLPLDYADSAGYYCLELNFGGVFKICSYLPEVFQVAFQTAELMLV